MGSRFPTRGSTGQPDWAEHCSRMQIVVYTESRPILIILPDAASRTSAGIPMPAIDYYSGCWKPAERLRGRLSRSNSALEEISPPSRYLDEPRRIRIWQLVISFLGCSRDGRNVVDLVFGRGRCLFCGG